MTECEHRNRWAPIAVETAMSAVVDAIVDVVACADVVVAD